MVAKSVSFFCSNAHRSANGAPRYHTESSSGRAGGVAVVTPFPVSLTVGPPGPVLRVLPFGPVLVGAKVTWMMQP